MRRRVRVPKRGITDADRRATKKYLATVPRGVRDFENIGLISIEPTKAKKVKDITGGLEYLTGG